MTKTNARCSAPRWLKSEGLVRVIRLMRPSPISISLSRYDRSRIVGRPVLYVVIDVFSRMIVGFYVGFEGPSWVGAMMALANTASDKVAFCKEFGIEIGADDWPCQGLPQFLLGDGGEMKGRHPETLINHFNVHVENTPPYRPDWKGVVERRFGLLPARFKAYVPGYVEGIFGHVAATITAWTQSSTSSCVSSSSEFFFQNFFVLHAIHRKSPSPGPTPPLDHRRIG